MHIWGSLYKPEEQGYIEQKFLESLMQSFKEK
ncbi:hypothetical protein Y015_04370 [Chlamydia muridarum str. Nigg CM972]|nr:hypothetical protein TAC_04370 [Chlamydia muridarum str. Nigg3 CMUT3-5]AHH24138.1 hypothetical protein Y015_04370 [Chlamydia muridarum str. Nigg CM972]